MTESGPYNGGWLLVDWCPVAEFEILRAPLIAALAEMSLVASSDQIERWLDYLRLLGQWNQRFNLTAIRQPQAMLTRHLLDSLSMAAHWVESELADIGSGAGFPGIPLAILQPQRSVILLESNGKKASFLREVQRCLELQNVTVEQQRAEAYRPDQPITLATARAVAPLRELGRCCRPWLAAGGRLLAMKGPGYAAELKQLPKGFDLHSVQPLQVPGLDGERVLVILQKQD